MIQAILALFGIAGQGVQTYVESKAAERKTKLEIKRIEAEGRVARAQALAQTEANYDNLAQQNMRFTFKDEYLMFVFTTPYVISFATPFLQLWIDKPETYDLAATLATSWELIAAVPDWWQWATLGMVIATYGLRWAAGGFQIPKLRKT